MLEISKNEVKYLIDKGVRYGSSIHHSVHNRHYYLTEYWKNLKLLDEYRNKHTEFVGENKRN